MQVSKCPVVVTRPVLFLNDIKKKEGVYRFKSKTDQQADGFNKSYPDYRIIVIADSSGSSVLYYNGTSLVPAVNDSWNQYVYEKTTETVCFELKKG